MLEFLSLVVFAAQAYRHKRDNPDASLGDSLAYGAAWGGGTYVLGRGLQAGAEHHRVATNPRVFMPHHHGPDGAIKEDIASAGASGELGFYFEDVSVTRPIRSRTPSRIRADLTRRVRGADKVMVVIGEQTHQRVYVNHEVEKALEAEKHIIAVKLAKHYRAPPSLYGAGVSWASPTPASIAKALDQG